jgi:hypothetical protein
MNRAISIAMGGLIALGLAACQNESNEVAAATSSPDDAIKAITQALKNDDLQETVRLALPPERFEEVKTRYQERMANEEPTEEEQLEFEAMMTKLTAPDAETALMAELEPALVQFETEMAAQMPLMVGMGRGFAAQAIQENADLSADQKQQATQALDAVANWLGTVKVADRDLARQAIGIATKTAREVDLDTTAEVRALPFEAMLDKAGVAFGGTKDILAVYGLDLDQTLDSATTEIVSEEGDNATVKVTYTLLGKPITSNTEMVRMDGRWYGKDSMAELEKMLAPPAAVPAAAGDDVMMMEDDSADEAMPLEGDAEMEMEVDADPAE